MSEHALDRAYRQRTRNAGMPGAAASFGARQRPDGGEEPELVTRAEGESAAVGRARRVLEADMSEADLLAWVQRLAGIFGWQHYHTHDSRRSTAGFPDLVLVRGRSLIFAELKAARGRVSDAQRTWLMALEASGAAQCFVWRPCDMDSIVEVLR